MTNWRITNVPDRFSRDQLKKATDRLVTGEVVMSSSRTRKAMQTGSEAAGEKAGSSSGMDPQKEAAYWREQHPKHPYAKNGAYEQFEHAYKTGYNSFFKYQRPEFRRRRRFNCARLRDGKTRFSIAMGHRAPRSKRGLGKNDRSNQSARPWTRCARLDLSWRGLRQASWKK